jgi:hypothetical protein
MRTLITERFVSPKGRRARFQWQQPMLREHVIRHQRTMGRFPRKRGAAIINKKEDQFSNAILPKSYHTTFHYIQYGIQSGDSAHGASDRRSKTRAMAERATTADVSWPLGRAGTGRGWLAVGGALGAFGRSAQSGQFSTTCPLTTPVCAPQTRLAVPLASSGAAISHAVTCPGDKALWLFHGD